MTKIIKYSKPFKDIKRIKLDFFKENEKLLKHTKKINKVYINQKKREKCKNCLSNLKNDFFMKSHDVNYIWCKKCNHLNGAHDDSEKFLEYLYSSDKGTNYSKNYKKDYDQRVKKIYLPKIKFLKQILKKKFDILDIGCGAGHLLKACEKLNVEAEGFDPNFELVNLGKKFLKKNSIKHIDLKSWNTKIINSKKRVLCLMGVLEHLKDPNLLLRTFVKSNIKYLYIQVPLFSLSSFIENIFPNIYPRVLSGGHTHLYTKESLDFLAKKYKLEIIGEWWFGTDIADLYRSISVLSKNKNKTYLSLIDKYVNNPIDKLQNVLDSKKLCSQVHMILKKKKS